MTCDQDTSSVSAAYGLNCFSNAVMRERLPKSVYKELLLVQAGEKELTLEIAEVVAGAMRDWALERGATHFSHWFQPLTGLTAEKHDSFIAPTGDGRVLMEFSGKELIKGEPDASSFPSGGLRATFEARGYTAWDTTSPAFLKEDESGITLCIPTAFIGYHGHALDKKVPLLKSMAALNKQALRVLRALGNTTSKNVLSTVGPEQEYFLIDKKYFELRPDLLLTGRTVFGSMPAKGQELEDHYFGAIKDRVMAFMGELNRELWKMGVSAKTQHNEVAPNQFELAPIFATTNVATDNNQLVMETIRKVANRHGMVALLHEKPFAGVNGSGKHNNWSISTDDGQNLLDPGENPQTNARFLLFTTAVLEAVDTWASLLRASAANPGNDHRLGANEAPPAIISAFLGSQLSELLDSIAEDKPYSLKGGEKIALGVTSLPRLPRDFSDRNRTSPFAFTGNKFEFRMVGSSQSIASANCVINTIVADALANIADRLEKASDKNSEIQKYIKESYSKHRRVVFDGNNYAKEWVAEAERRGLPNIRNTVDAIGEYIKPAAIELFERNSVLSKEELESRAHIYWENYSKRINIEASVMVEMSKRSIFPAVTDYAASLASSAEALASIKAVSAPQEKRAREIAQLLGKFAEETEKLEAVLGEAQGISDVFAQAKAFRDKVFVQMGVVRENGDKLETMVDRDVWPFPSYEELLFIL